MYQLGCFLQLNKKTTLSNLWRKSVPSICLKELRLSAEMGCTAHCLFSRCSNLWVCRELTSSTLSWGWWAPRTWIGIVCLRSMGGIMPDSSVKHPAHPSEPHLQLCSSSPYSSPRHFWNRFPLLEHQGNLSGPLHCSTTAGPFFSNTHGMSTSHAALQTWAREWSIGLRLPQNLEAEEVYVLLTSYKFCSLKLSLSSSLPPLFLLSPPVLKAGPIWAQVVEEDFNEMNSDSLL